MIKKIILFQMYWFCLFSFAGSLIPGIENGSYKISIPGDYEKNIRFIVTHTGSQISREVSPRLFIAFSAVNPNMVPTSVDGYDGIVGWKGDQNKVERNIFFMKGKEVIASKIVQADNRLIFTFPLCEFGEAILEVVLPKGNESPSFIMGIKTAKEGWYSLGFTGLSPTDPEKLDFLYQPLTWSWKRFPSQSCITEEAYSTTAATFISTSGFTEGIAAAPEMISYRYALSTRWSNKKDNQVGVGFAYTTQKGNSLFGLSVRNNKGLAQPMLFAPLLGGENSWMKAHQEYRFTCKYLLTPGDWIAGSEFLLRNIFRYKNERQNATVTLNQTLENMIEYGMNDRLSGWVDEFKAFDYAQDAPGTVKMVSALHALGVALSTGNYDIYKRRALPLIEYEMSREKYLFAIPLAIHGNQTYQNPSHFLKGPCAEIGELAGLYQMTGGKSVAFQKEAERLFGKPRQLNLQTVTGGATWQDYLARFKISGNPDDLDKAKGGASSYINQYVNKYPTDFASNSGLNDKQAAFQNDFTTNIYDLFELWEITHDKVYLEASRIGARQLVLWARSNPMAPDSLITVNKGGIEEGIFPGRRDGTSNNQFDQRDMSTRIMEQKIPAWRTSMVGLAPEQPGTYTYGPIMLTQYAAWFLRIAALTNDKLLADVAYNAVIGRYANFPGYYFTSLHTNVYQDAGYAVHDYRDIKYNAIFYNHVWPHIALLNDFLVSDAFYRSKGQVDFPSAYSPGYAFLTSKVYGGKPGKIFGNENINLWLPNKALQTSNVAVNHLFGVGKDALFLVLMNTSPKDASTEIQFNQDKITYDTDKRYPVVIYDVDGKTTDGEMVNGKLAVSIPQGSISVIKIKGLIMDIPLFHQYAKSDVAYGDQNYLRVKNKEESLGTITGMMINLTSEFSDAFVYSDVIEKTVRKAILKYKIGSADWQQREDSIYPFEFSIHLSDPKQPLVFKWISEDIAGKVMEGKEMILVN